MRQHAGTVPSTAWFRPSVRDVRYRAPRTVSAVASSARTLPAAPARVRSEPGRSWLERVELWLWRREQKRVEDYLSRSVDVADLEVRMRSLERRAPSGF